jgi:hypothetical protein
MADLTGVDWTNYLRALRADEVRLLATFLAVEGVQLGEFMEVVDHAFAGTPGACRARQRSFVTRIGQPLVQNYARRKRRYAGLASAFEQARISGAFPGDVAPHELRPLAIASRTRSVADLVAIIERGKRCTS